MLSWFDEIIIRFMKSISFVDVWLHGGKCPACNQTVSLWMPYGTKKIRYNAECPICRAAERDRIEILFWEGYESKYIKEDTKVLHFAPEKQQYLFWKERIRENNYVTADIDDSIPLVKKKEDITHMDFTNDYFDIIICNQVLEHVKDANLGINELARVLKNDGLCIITVPIDEKHATFEDSSIDTDEKRIKYYGETNHVRMYGTDFADILEENGLIAKRIYSLDIVDKKRMRTVGLSKKDYFWLCTKR